jgi:glycosyltransferase involved in cell wall biosynthesis
MAKKKLHIHSDNSEWAGCENMVGIFLQDKEIRREYDITFSYRYSPEYERGMRKWVPSNLFIQPRDGSTDTPISYTLNPVFRDSIPLELSISYLYKIRPHFRPIMVLKYICQVSEVIKIARLLNRIQPDVLHINNGGYPGATSCNSAAIAGRIARVPKITYMVNSTVRDLWWERPLTSLVGRSVDTFVTASCYLRHSVLSTFWRSCNSSYEAYYRCVVIPNTVRFLPTRRRNEVRKELGIKDGTVVLAAVGRLEERKGFHLLPRVAASLQMHGLDFIILIIGDGNREIKERIDREIAYWRVFDRCRLITGPERERINDYSFINSSDILVVPSLYDEDFPNVILIAMMFGKVVVASRLGGIPEVVRTNETGFTFEPGDIPRLVGILERLTRISEMRKTMGERGALIYNTCYERSKVIRAWIELWQK